MNNQYFYLVGPAFIEPLGSKEFLTPVFDDPANPLNITCVASGHERTITWTKDDQTFPVELFNRTVTTISGEFEFLQTQALKHELIWKPPKETCSDVVQHEGSYKCEATTHIREGYTRTDDQTFSVEVLCKCFIWMM